MRLLALVAALVVLALPAAAGAQPNTALRDEAFEAAQRAMTSEAADALARVSARFARGNGPLAQLVGRGEATRLERNLVESRIEAMYLRPGAEGEAERVALRKRYRDLTASLAAIDAELGRSFPEYADLVSPRPLSLGEVQDLLAPDEGLLVVMVNREATYVWGVTRDRVAWARADGYGTTAVAADVYRLRNHLMGAEGEEAPYDRARAYRVYDRIVRPVEAVFAGKTTLISVTEGMLATLPLSVLATDDEPSSPRYLIDRYALATLPAVSSLRSLRCLRAKEPPAACGGAVRRPSPSPATGRLAFLGLGAPAGLSVGDPDGSAPVPPPPVDTVFRRGLAQPAELRKLAALSGAEAELTALRARFPTGLVLAGGAATESAVKITHRDDFARSRYLVIATHGLMAGQMATAEPGLVLTPPAVPTELDDGFLSASEVAELQLSADFVALSACNTAASDGTPGGEGLSGLARAFFYAGARSILVSHWEVADLATASLMQTTFANLEGGEQGSRARALQRAMLAVRADPRFSDPGYWGAFTLVGEPTR